MSDKKARQAFRADPLLHGAASLVDQTVEGYSPEGFTINSITLPGTVLLLPQVSLLFHVNRLEELTPDSLEVLRLLDPPIEVLIVGTGRTLQPLPPATEEWLAAHCIAPELSPSRHACSTFIFMGAEGRRVAAVLFPPVDLRRRRSRSRTCGGGNDLARPDSSGRQNSRQNLILFLRRSVTRSLSPQTPQRPARTPARRSQTSYIDRRVHEAVAQGHFVRSAPATSPTQRRGVSHSSQTTGQCQGWGAMGHTVAKCS